MISSSLNSRVAACVLAGLGLTALALGDLSTPCGRVTANGTTDAAVLRGFGEYRPDRGGRMAGDDAHVAITGLWASAPLHLRLVLASRDGSFRVRMVGDNGDLGEGRLTPDFSEFSLRAQADNDGRLDLRFKRYWQTPLLMRLQSIEVCQSAPGWIPWSRLAQYAAFSGLLAWLVWRIRWRVVIQAAAIGWVAMAIVAARLHTLAVLPVLLVVLAVFALWFSIEGRVARWMPVGCARWVLIALVLRVLVALHPELHGGDAAFHAHNVWRYQEGLAVNTNAPGFAHVWYPVGFYAVLSPFMNHESGHDETVVSIAIAILDGLVPLLVLIMMRVSHASVMAAGQAAVAAALLPEGVLVLGKGIGTNVFGGFVGLLVLLAWQRRSSPLVVAGLLAICLLSHPGAPAALILLLLLWTTRRLYVGSASRQEAITLAACLFVAGVVAWVVYCRHIPMGLAARGSDFLAVRWFRLGKIAQDSLLKFGLLPLFLAVMGYRRASGPLRDLLSAWFVSGGLLGLLAVLTPFSLRFEYFLVPAVAMAAGLGAAQLIETRRVRWVQVIWLIVFALQFISACLMLTHHYQMIAVIMDSPRGTAPFHF